MAVKLKYVVAVSGGVDSVVLLDMILKNKLTNIQIRPDEIMVAHFDHGIRMNSAQDAELVKNLSAGYGISFELGRGELGKNASENQARQARYEFLNSVKEKYNIEAIITAHHQDDVLETMIINLARGTGWRGLVSLKSTEDLIRPLIDFTKDEIKEYAEKNKLVWREDETNQDQKYLRNYIRLNILPKLDTSSRSQLLEIRNNLLDLENNVAAELGSILGLEINDQEVTLKRYDLIMWPSLPAREVLYSIIRKLDQSWHPNRQQLLEILRFIKSGRAIKKFEVSKSVEVSLEMAKVRFKNTR